MSWLHIVEVHRDDDGFSFPCIVIFLITDSLARRIGDNVKRRRELKSIDLCVTREWQTKRVSPVGQVMLPVTGNSTGVG